MEDPELAVIAALWNCTDILPGDTYDQVQEITEKFGIRPPRQGTYAAAAQALMATFR